MALESLGEVLGYSKLMSYASAVEVYLEFQVEFMWVWLGPGVLGDLLVHFLVARLRIRLLLARVLVAVGRPQAESVGLQNLMDAVVQEVQILRGDRKHWDHRLSREAAKVGSWIGAVGMVLGPAGHVVGHGGRGVLRRVGGSVPVAVPVREVVEVGEKGEKGGCRVR
ncbi:hypothetical protein [Dactylosporangium darangshiense]|uniref:hypothetical protein n=1 Tax=Dactylosporangium darangshiense TaxID=579108 RepID=UPI00363B88AF